MKPHRHCLAALFFMSAALLFLTLGGALSSAQAQIQVTAADPPTAEQGTVNLNVKVTGKGFKNGAKAKWFITGTTDPGGVQVNSTTFVSSGELTANITVADTAVIANFDIAVTNADGRGGKGTELFAVTQKGGGGNTTCPPRQTTPCVTGSGCLDASFNGTGQVLTNIDGTVPSISDSDEAKAVMAQNDGKIVAVGETSAQSGTTFVRHVFVARYNSDGSLDTTSFGDQDPSGNRTGITRVSLLYMDTVYFGGGAIYTDASGNTKIIAAGYTQNSGSMIGIMFVIRLNSDGTLDTSFGDLNPSTSLRTGKKLIQIGNSTSTSARGVAIQLVAGVPQIFLGGYANGQGAVFKLRDNGDLDSSFNGQGYVNLHQAAITIALQTDGRIVAGGWVSTSRKSGNDFALTRLTILGQPDPTFGSNGQVTTDFFGYSDAIDAIALDSLGRIVAAGEVVRDKVSLPAVARYTASGQLEVKNTASYSSAGINSVVVQPDGKLVILGAVTNCSWSFAFTRFNASDLSIDTTFGSSGSVITSFGESGAISALAHAMTIQIDPACGCAKLVGAGSADTGSVNSVALTRLVP
jgi:uncharacterized delta-60 repeat protein